MKNIKTLGMVAVATAMLSSTAFASKDLIDSQKSPVKAHGVCVQTVGGVSACCDLSLNFASGSTALRSYNHSCLHEVAANVGNNATVVGYTDNVGNDKFNLKLSEGRARVVAGLLRRHGVDNVKVKGAGETSPIATNDTEAGRAANRRVEVQ